MKFRSLPILASAAALFVTGLLMAAPAQAIVFNLTSDHCTGGCRHPAVWQRDAAAEWDDR